jgi:pyruvate carboxylase
MKRALWEYQISGVKTNIPMHEVILDDEHFRRGEYTTHFIEDYKVLDRVQEYLKTRKAASQSGSKVAAITAAVGMYMGSVLAQVNTDENNEN